MAGMQGTRRDRRGRGMRGPAVLGAPGLPRPARPFTTREHFDRVLLQFARDIEARWSAHLGLMEWAVEDTPMLPRDWDLDRVPLASLVRGSGTTPSRLVVFRRPIEHRSQSRVEMATILLNVVCEQMAEFLGIAPEDVDPRYLPE